MFMFFTMFIYLNMLVFTITYSYTPGTIPACFNVSVKAFCVAIFDIFFNAFVPTCPCKPSETNFRVSECLNYEIIGSPEFYPDILPLPPPYYQGGARQVYPEAWPVPHHSSRPRSSYPNLPSFTGRPLRSCCAQR